MPRRPRVQPGGVIFHVLNRGNQRQQLFGKAEDYTAFLRVLRETALHVPMRLLAYGLMPNHWHLLLWPLPGGDGDFGRFMQRLTTRHVRRWRAHRHSVGLGHLYQGTYKSFPVQDDAHYLRVCRYVERNALRAGLVGRAEAWRWSSLGQWRAGRAGGDEEHPALAAWPVPRPAHWVETVNAPETDAELAALRRSVARGWPLGGEAWTAALARQLGLPPTLRPRGRPRKQAVPG